jgi:hypothetical protein
MTKPSIVEVKYYSPLTSTVSTENEPRVVIVATAAENTEVVVMLPAIMAVAVSAAVDAAA